MERWHVSPLPGPLANSVLTPEQKRDLTAAHQMVSDLNFRVTGKQVGNGIGALLASIGIPLAIEAVKKLTGKGVTGGSSMRIGKGSPRIGKGSPRIGRPPPFIGSWEGRGKKKKDRD